jgi:Tat protein translocase TatB subunit
MFGIGWPEMILIFIVALIAVGPKKLPELAKTLGKMLAELRKAGQEIKDSLELDEDSTIKPKDLIDSISGILKPSETAQSEPNQEKSPDPAGGSNQETVMPEEKKQDVQ